MAHKTRSEQLAAKGRKDPHKLARKTKQHSAKTEYKRRWKKIWQLLDEVDNE